MATPKNGIKMPAIHQRYIHYVDEKRVYYYIAQPLGLSKLASAPLDSRRIWGFREIAGNFTGQYKSTYSRIMASQLALGVPVSGTFSIETQIALIKEYKLNGPSERLFDLFLGCLGYEHGDVDLFQYIEGLEVTGELDQNTWNRAESYMGNIHYPDENGNDRPWIRMEAAIISPSVHWKR